MEASMKKIIIIIILVLTVLTLTALPAVVKNNQPLRGEWDFQLQEDWSVDTFGDDPLVSISSLKIDDDGTIYLLERKFGKVLAFNSKGKLLFACGREGEGPGEFKRAQVLYLVDKYLAVRDQGRRIHYFTKKGLFKNTYRLRSALQPRVFIDGLHFLALRQDLEKPEKTTSIELCDISSGETKVLAQEAAEKEVTASNGSERGDLTVHVSIDELTSGLIFAAGKNKNYFFYGYNDRYMIKKMDMVGKELLSFSLSGRKRNQVPMSYKKEQIKSLSSEIPQEIKNKILKGLPDQCTYFERIMVDPNGLIYVYVTDVANTRGWELDIFSPDGKYLYHSKVTLPEGLHKRSSLVFKKDRAVVFVENEEGELKLLGFSIKPPVL
jgi:6-bladed beta-propeller